MVDTRMPRDDDWTEDFNSFDDWFDAQLDPDTDIPVKGVDYE